MRVDPGSSLAEMEILSTPLLVRGSLNQKAHPRGWASELPDTHLGSLALEGEIGAQDVLRYHRRELKGRMALVSGQQIRS